MFSSITSLGLTFLFALQLGFSSPSDKAFFEAISNGDKAVVQKLLAEGKDANTSGPLGYTPLMAAINGGDVEIVTILLSYKVNINTPDSRGDTPLILAINKGNPEIVKVLIKHGAQVNIGDAHGITPLIKAIKDKKQEIITILVAAGADVNAQTVLGRRPISIAFEQEDYKLVDFLITQKAKLNYTLANDNYSYAPILIAAKKDDTKLLNIALKNGSDPNTSNSAGKTALMMLSESGSYDGVKLLLENNAALTKELTLGLNACFYSAFGGYEKVFELINSKFDCATSKDIHNRDIISEIINRRVNSKLIAHLLVKSDSTPKDESTLNTLLLRAASYGNDAFASAALKHGADANANNEYGRSALFIASSRKHPNVVKTLLKYGAKVNDSGDHRKSPIPQVSVSRNTNPDTPLITAVRNSNAEAVKEILKHKPDLEAKDSNGETALFLACNKTPDEMALELIKRGANVNAIGRDGFAPLLNASSWGNTRVAKALIDKGANINHQAENGDTPLLRAAQAQKNRGLALVNYLLDLGVNKDLRHRNGDNALGVAIQAGNEKVVETLLNHGFDPNQRMGDYLAETPLMDAVRYNHANIIQRLLTAGANVNELAVDPQNRYQTALSLAKNRNYPEIEKLLITAGAKDIRDITKPEKPDRTLVERIVYDKHVKSPELKLLHGATFNKKNLIAAAIKEGVDINIIVDKQNQTALIRSVQGFIKPDIVKFLLENGANTETRARVYNDTPLMIAAKRGNLPTVRLLIEHGAKVNALNANGETALWHSLIFKKLDVTEYLLQKGANPNIKNKNGEHLLTRSVKRNNKDVAELLLKYGADIDSSDITGNTPLMLAVKQNKNEQANMLMSRGADLTIQDNYGADPLIVAARNNDMIAVKKWINKGLDVNTREKNGYMPLFHAINHNNIEMVKFLIENKADVNAFLEKRNKITPLIFALQRKDRSQIVKLLLMHKAEINHKDFTGRTPLVHALLNHHDVNVVELLLEKSEDIYTKNNGVGSAFDLGISSSNQKISKLFFNYAKNNKAAIKSLDHKLLFAIRYENLAMVNRLLEFGANPNYVDQKSGMTVLMTAAQNGYLSIVKALVENGANINTTNKTDYPENVYTTHGHPDNKMTALLYAMKSGQFDTASYLISKGADVNVQSSNGYTSLMYAAGSENIEISLNLLAHGADINAKTPDGTTAITIAKMKGQQRLLELLMSHGH